MNGFNMSNASNITIGSITVNAVYLGNTLVWPTNHDYSQDYFTIKSLEDDNTIYWNYNGIGNPLTISVSTDNGTTWTTKTPPDSGRILLATLNTNEKLLVKGNNSTYYGTYTSNGDTYASYHYFNSFGYFDAEGNIMSLVYGDNFANQTTLTAAGTFYRLFSTDSGSVWLRHANNLVLPATTLTDYCYRQMFSTRSLLSAPSILPATTLSLLCYAYMFSNCSSLVNAPELPATTLAIDCCTRMFYGCSSLVSAPELPATTLVTECYDSMFMNCTSLNYVKMMATSLPTWTTNDMLNNVAASGTFVKNVNATWNNEDLVPSGWTVQTASS